MANRDQEWKKSIIPLTSVKHKTHQSITRIISAYTISHVARARVIYKAKAAAASRLPRARTEEMPKDEALLES